MMRKPIVIIGGMGPQASVRFHELLLTKSAPYHSGNGDEYPFVVHFSLPVADFISDRVNETAAVKLLDSLSSVIQHLQPQSIALACNTAHRLVPRTLTLRQPAFISMLETVAQRIAAAGVHTIGIMASPTTIRTRLYDAVLARRGITVVRPLPRQLSALEGVIRHVIAGNISSADTAQLGSIARSLGERGAEAVLLGCTELPLAFDAAQSTLPAYDCLDIYADAVVHRYYEKTTIAILEKRNHPYDNN